MLMIPLKIGPVSFLLFLLSSCVMSSITKNETQRSAAIQPVQVTHYSQSYRLEACSEIDLNALTCAQSLKFKSEEFKFEDREYEIALIMGASWSGNTEKTVQRLIDMGFQRSRISINSETASFDSYIIITEFPFALKLASCIGKLGKYKFGCSATQNRALIINNPHEINFRRPSEIKAFERAGEGTIHTKGSHK